MRTDTIEDLEALPDHEQERLDAVSRAIVRLNQLDPAFGPGPDEEEG